MKSPPVALGMAAVSVFFMGQFMLFTYLRPFLETVTQVSVSMLSLMLLVLGLAGLAGTFLIEAFLKNGLHRTLIVIPILMAMIALALVSNRSVRRKRKHRLAARTSSAGCSTCCLSRRSERGPVPRAICPRAGSPG